MRVGLNRDRPAGIPENVSSCSVKEEEEEEEEERETEEQEQKLSEERGRPKQITIIVYWFYTRLKFRRFA